MIWLYQQLDDYRAMVTANAAEQAGATVVSITCTGIGRSDGERMDSARYAVWVRGEERKRIDDEVKKAMERLK